MQATLFRYRGSSNNPGHFHNDGASYSQSHIFLIAPADEMGLRDWIWRKEKKNKGQMRSVKPLLAFPLLSLATSSISRPICCWLLLASFEPSSSKRSCQKRYHNAYIQSRHVFRARRYSGQKASANLPYHAIAYLAWLVTGENCKQ